MMKSINHSASCVKLFVGRQNGQIMKVHLFITEDLWVNLVFPWHQTGSRESEPSAKEAMSGQLRESLVLWHKPQGGSQRHNIGIKHRLLCPFGFIASLTKSQLLVWVFPLTQPMSYTGCLMMMSDHTHTSWPIPVLFRDRSTTCSLSKHKLKKQTCLCLLFPSTHKSPFPLHRFILRESDHPVPADKIW